MKFKIVESLVEADNAKLINKQRYLYKGPVFRFGKLYDEQCEEIHTVATSDAKAINNICSQLKQNYGLTQDANLTIDKDQLILYEFDEPETLVPGDDISED